MTLYQITLFRHVQQKYLNLLHFILRFEEDYMNRDIDDIRILEKII